MTFFARGTLLGHDEQTTQRLIVAVPRYSQLWQHFWPSRPRSAAVTTDPRGPMLLPIRTPRRLSMSATQLGNPWGLVMAESGEYVYVGDRGLLAMVAVDLVTW